MRTALPSTVLAALAILTGCGGTTPEEEIKDTARAYLSDLKAGKYADACQHTVDPDRCIEQLLTAKAFGVEPRDVLPSDMAEKIDDATVTVRGDTATMDATDGDDATWHRRDGRWLAEVPSTD